MFDVIIIGKGPAGISASLYTTRAKLNTLIIGGESILSKSHRIDNYYGFPNGISGEELCRNGEQQSQNLGSQIINDKVLSIGFDGQSYTVTTNTQQYETKAILLSTGQSLNRVKIENIDKFEGKGIHYCVICDGFFYNGKKVGILGYTDYALHEAKELYNFSKDVTIYTNGKEFEISDKYKEALNQNLFKINTKKITGFIGEDKLQSMSFDDESNENIDGLFVAYGSASSVDFARKLGIMINKDTIIVDKNHMTNVPGIFAAGDCTAELKQISVAVGQGAIAGQKIVEYIRDLSK